MGEENKDIPGLNDTGLSNPILISDPNCDLYRSFGLEKGSFWDMFQPSVWIRGFQATLRGHKAGALAGDGLQMPGMFLVRDGEIVAAHRAENAADSLSPQALGEKH